MNRQLRRPYRKLYAASPLSHLINLDRDAARRGFTIEPGTVVTVLAHYGPFRRIRDEAGNEMSVGRYSLIPVPKNLDQLKAKADTQARATAVTYVVLVDALGVAQVLRQDIAERSISNQPGSYFIAYEADPFTRS